jgi:hypothetical protein
MKYCNAVYHNSNNMEYTNRSFGEFLFFIIAMPLLTIFGGALIAVSLLI